MMIDDCYSDYERCCEYRKGYSYLEAVREGNIGKAIRIMKSMHNIDLEIMVEHPSYFGTDYERYQTPIQIAFDSRYDELIECATELGGHKDNRGFTY
jgi:hypothetical protein